MRLGFWQLSRAEQKSQLQQSIEQQAQLPPLNLAQLLSDPSAWSQTHRRVQLQGEWLNDKTVFLDNRAHHGRVGFWVMTPLRVQAGQVVWVQRGWVERDALDPRKAPMLQPAVNGVTLEARIAPALSQIFELGSGQQPVTGANLSPIRANLDLAQMQSRLHLRQVQICPYGRQVGTCHRLLTRTQFEYLRQSRRNPRL